MGMYDTLTVICPHCGHLVEFQSKAGECTLANYSLETVPIDIANDLKGDYEICSNCDTEVYAAIAPKKGPETVKMIVYKDGEWL